MCECGCLGAEITMVSRLVIPLLRVACRTATGRRERRYYSTQERATKICLVGPLGVSAAQGAVARWDGNVALQRWGCGRCRPGDGGRGYRFTARRSLSLIPWDIEIIILPEFIFFIHFPFVLINYTNMCSFVSLNFFSKSSRWLVENISGVVLFFLINRACLRYW